jgi:hypothetical protein
MNTRYTSNELGNVLAWVNEFAAATSRAGFDRAEGRYVLRAYDAAQRAYPKNNDRFHPGGIPTLESIYSEADRLRTEAAASVATTEASPAVA